MGDNKSYFDTMMEDLRLVILRKLHAANAYTLNAHIIKRLVQAEGHTHSLDTIKAQIHWLAEQGLVEEVSDPPMVVATLTERGADIAAGHATFPGVKRPLPGQ